MRMTVVLASTIILGLLGGCGVQPTASAFSRNVGFGSSVFGPQSQLGSSQSGNTYVPGAPAAGGINGNGGN